MTDCPAWCQEGHPARPATLSINGTTDLPRSTSVCLRHHTHNYCMFVTHYTTSLCYQDTPMWRQYFILSNGTQNLTFPTCLHQKIKTLITKDRHVKNMGVWWRWALVSLDRVAPSRMVCVSASVNLPMHNKVQKFSSGTGSPGWSRKKGRKMVVVWWWWHTVETI